MKNFLLKHKIFLALSIVSGISLLFVLSKSTPNNYYQPDDSSLLASPTGTSPLQPLPEILDGKLNEKDPLLVSAKKAKSLIKSHLPIYLDNFVTSVGQSVTATLFTLPSDPDHSIHLEVYGVNYQENSLAKENPQYISFVEVFEQLKIKAKKYGVELKDIYLMVESDALSRSAAESWIKDAKLLE